MGSQATAGRREAYQEVLERLDALLEGETDWVAAMATVSGEIYRAFDDFGWVGFYRWVEEDALVVGPYQGFLGCLRVEIGRGVCGTAAAEKRTLVVDDVHAFPGYIACDDETVSEIVVPVFRADGSVLAVLDIDSAVPAGFGPDDVEALERLCAKLGRQFGATP